MTEEKLHEAVCRYISLQYPNVLFSSDMSGFRLTIGQAKRAAKLRSSRAYPDIVCYSPRGGFHGLFVELKKEDVRIYKRNGDIVSNAHIIEQKKMLVELNRLGYYADFACGLDEAIKLIDKYMSYEQD
jgi:hypothetical protein